MQHALLRGAPPAASAPRRGQCGNFRLASLRGWVGTRSLSCAGGLALICARTVGTAAWGRPARICVEYREYLRWGGAGPTRTLAKYVPLFRANWTAWATLPPPAWQPAVDAEAAALAAA